MSDFLITISSYPNVIFTVLLGIATLYWTMVMMGVLDLDGGVDGALDGAVEGASDGLIEGIGEAMESVGDMIESAGESVDAAGEGASLLSILQLRNAPITVVGSVFALLGWLGTFFGTVHVRPLLPGPDWLSATLTLLATIVLALPLTSLLTRPLRPVFANKAGGLERRNLQGEIVTVRLGGAKGQGELRALGSTLLVPIRVDTGALERGQQALIVGYDEDENVYEVELMDELLKEKSNQR